ncbi:hypothetical protein ACF0H5_007627 [Mactra antiquata]
MSKKQTFEEELAEAKSTIPTIEGFTLVTCVAAQVRASYRKTDQKQLSIILQFPDNYPEQPVVIELTSKTLSDKLLNGMMKLCDDEIKKYIGKSQVLPVMRFVREFMINNPLCVCNDEIATVKKDLLNDEDKIKLKQDTSQIIMKIVQERYNMNLKITVPDLYPSQQVQIEAAESNFPDILKVFFVGQAVEIARKCVQPPGKPNTKGPPFKPRPSLLEVCSFLIKDCVKRYPLESCAVCTERVLLEDPEGVTKDPRKRVERVYCGHLYHHGCLAKYMKTPPFKDGKFCPTCGKQIFHDKWKVSAELAEARWAHKQARQRELAEVTDFLS